MKIKIELLKQILDIYPKDLIVDANITLNIIESTCSPSDNIQEDKNIWDKNVDLEPINPWFKIWIHPIFKELNYSDSNAMSITENIIEGMKVCKKQGITRNLPTGIINYCSGFNRRLSSYYHDFNKADKVINEIIDNNKQLWN